MRECRRITGSWSPGAVRNARCRARAHQPASHARSDRGAHRPGIRLGQRHGPDERLGLHGAGARTACQAMTRHGREHRLHVLRQHHRPSVDHRPRAGRRNEHQPCPRAQAAPRGRFGPYHPASARAMRRAVPARSRATRVPRESRRLRAATRRASPNRLRQACRRCAPGDRRRPAARVPRPDRGSRVRCASGTGRAAIPAAG